MKADNERSMTLAQQTIKEMVAQMTNLANAVAENKQQLPAPKREDNKENSNPNNSMCNQYYT